MGLTIHYSLELTEETFTCAQEKMRDLHRMAQDLPLAKVDDLIQLEGEDCQVFADREDPNGWLKIQACQYVNDSENFNSITPEKMIAFSTWPGEGCEPANFGLAIYENRGIFTPKKTWSWSSFCKTQYASNPEYGGIANFLRCHLLVIKMLDNARNLGILKLVEDEGGYWENRNIEDLVHCVSEYNSFVAAIVGQLSHLVEAGGGETAYCPIAEYPNFEYLEAEGLQRLEQQNNPDSPSN